MSAVMTQPAALTIGVDGSLRGSTTGYQKFLGDMAGVYRDEQAHADRLAAHGPDHLVYSVEEHRADDAREVGVGVGVGVGGGVVAEAGALIIGTSTLLPGSYGEEFALTRGHLHAKADRAELYHCLSGHGVMLLETLDGDSRAVELVAGQAVHVPGNWVHRSVNVGDDPFVTLFCYAADAGQNYDLISRAGGMATIVVQDGDGWKAVPNPDHIGYQL